MIKGATILEKNGRKMADIIYNRAIEKNLGEITYALWELNILKELDSYIAKNHVWYLGMSFFRIAKSALFYDMMSSAAKVLELSKYNNPTFWYILKNDKGIIRTLNSYSEEKIGELKILARKLKDIRNQDLFHLDERGILYSEEIWDAAHIIAKEFNESLQYLFCILNELYENVFKKKFNIHLEDYDGKDFIQLLDLAASNDLIRVSPKEIND